MIPLPWYLWAIATVMTALTVRNLVMLVRQAWTGRGDAGPVILGLAAWVTILLTVLQYGSQP